MDSGDLLIDRIHRLIEKAREVAVEYYQLTGKPLGITGEVGEWEAARLLGLNLAAARETGFDATDSAGRRLQIKTRSIPASKPLGGQRLGSIDINKPWDAVLLILMDEEFQPTAIYEAGREDVVQALVAPGSIARNKRGALSVSKFKSIGKCVWSV